MFLAVETAANLEDPALQVGERPQPPSNRLPAQGVACLLERTGSRWICEEVTKLAVAIRADCLIEGHGSFDGAEGFLDMLKLQPCGFGELLTRGLTSMLRFEAPSDTRELHPALMDMRRPRISRDWFEIARWQACRIHHVAYVENRQRR